MSDAEKKMVMRMALPILAGHVIPGTDTIESMGHKLVVELDFHEGDAASRARDWLHKVLGE